MGKIECRLRLVPGSIEMFFVSPELAQQKFLKPIQTNLLGKPEIYHDIGDILVLVAIRGGLYAFLIICAPFPASSKHMKDQGGHDQQRRHNAKPQQGNHKHRCPHRAGDKGGGFRPNGIHAPVPA